MNLLLVLLTLGASFFTIAIVIWVMLARRRMP
jgi:hypothetical protein